MNKIKWDPKELYNLCLNKSLNFPEKKFKYLINKIDRYNLLKIKFFKLYEQYYEIKKNSLNLDNNSTLLSYEYSNYFELSSNLIYSCYEIIAHIINEILLNNIIPENSVFFNKIIKKIDENVYKKLYDYIKYIYQDYSYKYIKAFINTIKHIGLIKSHYKLGIKKSFLEDLKYPYIEKFKYYDDLFNEYSSEQFFECGNNNINYIIKIGNLINDCLK